MKTNSIIIILGVIVIALLSVLILKMQKDNGVRQPVACTLEAKICPDGSAVGRTGPNCEFSPCPGQY